MVTKEEERLLSQSFVATPLPKRQVLIICLINANEAVQINIIWPFVPFMVKDFMNSPSVGFYVGLVASSFFLSQLFSNVMWGVLSDRIGRRPVLLFGLAGTMVGQLILGFASSYPMAVAGRVVSGFLNGNIGVTKCYLGEITDKTNQSKGFGMVSLSYGMGAVFAPTLGGLLADPASKSSLFNTPFWRQFPYLLPCLVSCSTALIGVVLGLCFLPETEAWKRNNNTRRQAEAAKITESVGLDEGPYLDEDRSQSIAKPSAVEDAKEIYMRQQHRGGIWRFACCVPMAVRDESVFATTALYGLFAIVQILHDELYPLFAETSPDQGGLGFNSSQIGMFLSFNGLSLFVFQLFFYHKLVKRYGAKVCYLGGCVAFAPYLLFFPTTSILNSSCNNDDVHYVAHQQLLLATIKRHCQWLGTIAWVSGSYVWPFTWWRSVVVVNVNP